MSAAVQIKRTLTPDLAPIGLAEGELALEMASTPPRLWSGAPITIDPSGRILVAAGPGGGLVTVNHDATMTGDGAAVPLSAVHWAAPISLGLVAAGGTTIAMTAASFDGSASVDIAGFEITRLDAGAY